MFETMSGASSRSGAGSSRLVVWILVAAGGAVAWVGPPGRRRWRASRRPPPLRATVERSEFLYATEIVEHSETLACTLVECDVEDREEMQGYADRLDPFMSYLRPSARSAVRYAVEVAFLAHRAQLRRSGEPFVTHPVAVA